MMLIQSGFIFVQYNNAQLGKKDLGHRFQMNNWSLQSALIQPQSFLMPLVQNNAAAVEPVSVHGMEARPRVFW